MRRFIRSSRKTALGSKQPARYFTVTHPFHPWRGRRLEPIDCQRQWGEWRVYYLIKSGHRVPMQSEVCAAFDDFCGLKGTLSTAGSG